MRGRMVVERRRMEEEGKQYGWRLEGEWREN